MTSPHYAAVNTVMQNPIPRDLGSLLGGTHVP